LGHEDFHRVESHGGSSDRSFGLVFSAAFALVAFWPILHRAEPRWWSLGVSLGFAAIALVRPKLLALPNRLWTALGLLLGRVVSPIALAILFFLVLMPIGVAVRLLGKDPLKLKRDAASTSYWIPRMPPGPPPDSMGNQF
jgi:hypothetical protein